MQSIIERQNEAWAGWVGEQSVEEFVAESAAHGFATIEVAVSRYVRHMREFVDEFRALSTEEQAEAERLLLGYIHRHAPAST